MSTAPGLHTLSRPQGHAVPPPKSRWRTRLAVPAIILIAVAGLLAYAARDTLRPAVAVHVAPVVVRQLESGSTPAATASSTPTLAIQAPGWIEPAPYAVSVAALAEGVVEEVRFLEGQKVRKGDVMVQMVDIDARLSVALIRAELESLAAGIDRAKADVSAEQARVAELEDEEQRTTDSAAGNAATESEVIRVRARLDAQRAAFAAAQSAVAEAVANHARVKVMCQEADLRLERMSVKAPVEGVVLARLIEPGTRVSLSDSSGDAATMGVVARLYDPATLQVRVDVPLADAGKLVQGMTAEIETEAVPNHIFHGTVSRIVHEANIQRNTIQAKVAIADPIASLKPEMLARVRLFSMGSASGATAGAPAADAGASLLVPSAALMDLEGQSASVWLIDQRHATVTKRAITLTGATMESHAQVASGLAPGDRVAIDPPSSLREGARVRAQEGR